jgi:hypothetical protein
MPIDAYIGDLFTAAGPPPLDFEAAARCIKAARRMPLSHALRASHTAFLTGASAEILSRIQRGEAPSPAQRFAGTGDMVCLWVGPMRIPDREAALVFAADIERPGATATPWDSGGLHRRRALHLDEAGRQALVARRTMPAPGYREGALAAAIFLRHGTPERYIRAEIAQAVDPDRVYTAGELSSFTFECRIQERVPVKTTSLLYAAARRDALNAGLNALRAWCGERDVPFEVVDDHGRHSAVIDAVLSYFMELG